jgi:predicted SAM-dependent methyltransferase
MECYINDVKNEFGDRMQKEFTYIEKYLYTEVNGQKRFKNGVDVGCGTNRLSPGILSIDAQGDPRYSHAMLVHDCHDLNIFNNNVFDFIFSSHCLEDFSDIYIVFENWWQKIKPYGMMILLLPDMNNCNCVFCKGKSRYPKVGEANGNPSHKTNITKKYIHDMLQSFAERNKIKYKILQEDTIPHNESCTIDFVIQKMA